MFESRRRSNGASCLIAIAFGAFASFAACDDEGGDPKAEMIATSQKACSINLDCEIEGQECATSGPRAGSCAPTLCASPADCLDTEECVSSAGDDLGWCITMLGAGDPCTPAENQKFMCIGQESTPQVLTCEGGTWGTQYACPNQQPCLGGLPTRVLTCGTGDFLINYAVEGWPCEAEQSAACTFDQGALLNCQAGTWIHSETCSENARKCELVDNGDLGIFCEGNAPRCLACR